MSTIQKSPKELQQLHEQFLNDSTINLLHRQKAEVIQKAMPKYYIKHSDKIEAVYDTEVMQILNKIDEMLYSYIDINYPQLAK